MRTRLVLAVGSLALVLALVLTLSVSEPRRAGTNNVAPAGVVAALASGQEVCQAENVPPGASRVVLGVEPATGPPHRLAVRMSVRGRVHRGRGAEPAEQPTVSAQLADVVEGGDGSLCVRNAGQGELRLLGASSAGEPPEVGAGDTAQATGPLRVDYYRAGEETWWELGATVADRLALGNAGFLGPWALWLAVALSLGAAALAIAVLARAGRER